VPRGRARPHRAEVPPPGWQRGLAHDGRRIVRGGRGGRRARAHRRRGGRHRRRPRPAQRTAALALGATAAVDPTAGDVAERIRELTHGRGVDYAFEVAGLEATLAPAHESLRSGGALVIVGVQSPATTFPFGPLEMFARETRVLGCMYGSTRMHRDVVRLVELAEAGRLDIAALVSRRIALDEVNDALQAIERGEVIRSVIVS
jgi:S-(hydroxymethyl)glutathione dehydrogenase / alcohol dehydrogenase